MLDTSPAAEQVRIAAIRCIDPIQRMRLALEMSEWARALALARLRALHPDWSEPQLVELLLARIHDDRIFARL
ncbi:MAG: hypothetical protein ACRENI_03310 [Gemmatimonadaceae bacterium]